MCFQMQLEARHADNFPPSSFPYLPPSLLLSQRDTVKSEEQSARTSERSKDALAREPIGAHRFRAVGLSEKVPATSQVVMVYYASR